MRHILRRLAWLAFGTLPAPSAAQIPADYHLAAKALSRRVIQAGDWSIAELQIGAMGLDTNRFAALVTNRGRTSRLLGLSLRAMPGLWVRGNWQRGFRFEVPAGESRRIEAHYVFRRLTPEATLRVTFGTPREDGGGLEVVAPIYDTTLAVGAGNPAGTDPRLSFEYLRTPHFDVYAWRGGPAARRLREIADAREAALRRVANLLGVRFEGRIQLVLYPDSASKTSQTGHIGAGFAGSGRIVEIFSDSVQLDPFHEVAHIVAAERGSPPAMLAEGFAVHVSEALGADALKYLGAPGRSVAQVVCGYRRAGKLIPLDRLFRFTDIGSDSTLPDVSYPQSASLSAFLMERYGLERFRNLYGRLEESAVPEGQQRNERTLREITGKDLASLGQEWSRWLDCSRASPP